MEDTESKIKLIWQQCGEDIEKTGQVGTVFNCYVPVEKWVVYFYLAQLGFTVLAAIAMGIKLKFFTLSRREKIKRDILNRIKDREKFDTSTLNNNMMEALLIDKEGSGDLFRLSSPANPHSPQSNDNGLKKQSSLRNPLFNFS